jgi:hypothetical protein
VAARSRARATSRRAPRETTRRCASSCASTIAKEGVLVEEDSRSTRASRPSSTPTRASRSRSPRSRRTASWPSAAARPRASCARTSPSTAPEADPRDRAARGREGQGPVGGRAREGGADAYKRLLAPTVESDVRVELKMRADREAVDVFAQNLRELLLAAPFGGRTVLGIDPGQRTGCKSWWSTPRASCSSTRLHLPRAGRRGGRAQSARVAARARGKHTPSRSRRQRHARPRDRGVRARGAGRGRGSRARSCR